MKNKLLNNTYSENSTQDLSSTVITIENSEALDIFGVNNKNINFFKKKLQHIDIKIFIKFFYNLDSILKFKYFTL